MNRADLQKLADLRVKDAKVLLDNARYEGSYYLAGYAVECALKACIAKQTNLHDFPPPRKVVDAIYTHNLERLMISAGLQQRLVIDSTADRILANHWIEVRKWSEEFRYDLSVTEMMARDMYTAVSDGKHGVLTWLKKYW